MWKKFIFKLPNQNSFFFKKMYIYHCHQKVFPLKTHKKRCSQLGQLVKDQSLQISVHTPQQTSSNIIKSQVVKVCVKQLNFLYRIVLKKDIIKRFSTTFYQKNSALAIYDQAKMVSWIFSILQRYSREKKCVGI